MSKTHRALLLLEHIAAGGPPQTHGELMRSLGVPRSTLSDLLNELRELGYLELIDRHYSAGPRLIALIHRGSARRNPVLDGVRPILEQIAAETGETAVYSIRAGDSIISLEQAPSANPIRYVAELWEPFPVETTSPGMVFQAHDRDPPPHLSHVREKGYAVYAPGPGRPAAIAAPVRDPRGEIAGAIVVVGPPDRLQDPDRVVWPALQAGIRRLQARAAQATTRNDAVASDRST